jgi:cell wall assembly regulator SMI1
MTTPSVERCAKALTSLAGFEAMRKSPPATGGDLAQLATSIGRPLPGDLADWLRQVNGLTQSCLGTGWCLLSTAEIAMHWGFLADPAQALAPLVGHTDHPHRVRMPPDFRTRIPIAADYSGNQLAIDCDPARSEFVGQILYVSRDSDGEVMVIFECFAALLDAIADDITAGRMVSDGGSTQFVPPRGPRRWLFERARAYRLTPWKSDAANERFVASLTQDQRSACYLGQNDLLETDQFGATDIDLVRTVRVQPDMLRLLENPTWLGKLPSLTDLVICGSPPAHAYVTLSKLSLWTLTLQCASPAGYSGFEAMAGNRTLASLSLFNVDQSVCDRVASLNYLQRLWLYGKVDDLSPVASLPMLRSLGVSGNGRPDTAPVWHLSLLREFTLSWHP